MVGSRTEPGERGRDHTASQAALREILEPFRPFADAVADGLIVIDEAGRILLANAAAGRMFGYTAEELANRKVGDLMPSPYREQHDRFLGRFLETGERRLIGSTREVPAIRRDGSTFRMEIEVAELHLPAARVFLGTVRDRTAAHRAEEALRAEHDFAESLLDKVPLAILVLDEKGRVVRFNRCFETISGYSLEEARGADWFSFFLPEAETPRIREVFERVLAGQASDGTVNAIRTRSGKERLVEWYNTTLHDPDGGVSGVLAIGRDITERHELEQQLRQAQKMESIGRLAGGVAHDFNTILLTIGGRVEQLRTDPSLAAPARRQLDEIARAAERATALTRQLLAVSRPEPGRPGVLDLNRVVRDLEDMVRRLLGADVRVVTRLAEDLAPVCADRSQLEQVILNLVVNSRDAMPDGGQLRLETRNVEFVVPGSTDPTRWVLLGVRDTGLGMDDDTRKRVFEPFFTTKEPGRGTGLGLSTVHGIVTHHGGEIRIESAPGEGTAVEIYFPRADAAPARPREEVPRALPPVSAEGTLLLVEDDRAARELLQDFLEERGFRVLAAEDGPQALELLEREAVPVEVVLSDWVLPKLRGPDLVERVQARYPAVGVVYMSGRTTRQLPVELTRRPGVRFLHKPFALRDLAATLESVRQECRAAPRSEPSEGRAQDP